MDHFIVGAGAFAEVAKCYFEEYSGFRIKGFAVNERNIHENLHSSTELLTIENLLNLNPSTTRIFVAIGYSKMNQRRTEVFNQFESAGFEFLSFIHPDVKVWGNSNTGRNCFIFEGNTLQPFTRIGDNTILWSGNHIGHHSTVGKNCFISSHVVISGSCIIGDNSFIGVNATLHDGISIGEYSLIGAGAIISKDTLPGSVYAPAATPIFPKKSNELRF